jgi:hypothetical protein
MRIAFEKLAATGAVVVSVALLALFAALVAIMWPNPAGGMNRDQLAVGVIACACPAAALIAIHLAFAKQLLDATRPPSRRAA